MTRVNLDVSIYHNNDADEEDDGPWAYRGTTSGSVDRVYVAGTDFDWSYRGMETELKPPFYAVYATYTTGDTFGSDFEACVVGVVKTEEEAKALVAEAYAFTGHGILSNEFYVPWNGYFESLINVQYALVD